MYKAIRHSIAGSTRRNAMAFDRGGVDIVAEVVALRPTVTRDLPLATPFVALQRVTETGQTAPNKNVQGPKGSRNVAS